MTIVPTPLKAKFAHEIGTRISLRIYWSGGCGGNPNSYHDGRVKLNDLIHPLVLGDHEHHGGNPSDYPLHMWPKVCDRCGVPTPQDESIITRQVFNERLYDTPSGKPEPGSLYYAYWLPLTWCWDNKIDWFLYAVCPDGDTWNIDGRASNCTMKEDRNHRCWCRHGEPETGNIHVDKNGITCAAGAGSILTSKGWHGFLHQGYFIG